MPKARVKIDSFKPDELMLEEIKLYSKQGMRVCHLQDYFSVSRTAWNSACKRQPEIMKAYRAGKSHGIKVVTCKLLEMALKGNMKAIELYLRLVGKFSENVDPDEEQKPENKPATITFTVTDPVQAAKTYQQIIQGSTKNE